MHLVLCLTMVLWCILLFTITTHIKHSNGSTEQRKLTNIQKNTPLTNAMDVNQKHKKDQKLKVYIRTIGRLGNTMCQIASLYGLCRTSKKIPVIVPYLYPEVVNATVEAFPHLLQFITVEPSVPPGTEHMVKVTTRHETERATPIITKGVHKTWKVVPGIHKGIHKTWNVVPGIHKGIHKTGNVVPGIHKGIHKKGNVVPGIHKGIHKTGNVAPIIQGGEHTGKTGNVPIITKGVHMTGNVVHTIQGVHRTGNVVHTIQGVHRTGNVHTIQEVHRMTGNVVHTIQEGVNKTRNVPTIQEGDHKPRSVPTIQEGVHKTRSVPSIQEGVHKTRSVPTIQEGVNKTRSVPTIQEGVNKTRSVPTLQEGVNKTRSVSTIQEGVHKNRSVPTNQEGVHKTRNVPIIQEGVHKTMSVPTIQEGVNNTRSVPSMHEAVHKTRSVPTLQEGVNKTSSVPFIQEGEHKTRSVPTNQTVHKTGSITIIQEGVHKTRGIVPIIQGGAYIHIAMSCQNSVEILPHLFGVDLWRNYQAEIDYMFDFSDEIKRQSREIFDNIYEKVNGLYANQDIVYIGIHVRKGDKVNKKAYKLPSSAYYHRAIHHCRLKYRPRKAIFLISSDSIDWCKNHFRNYTDVYILEGSPYVDLATLKKCDHSILSEGTFSLWVGLWTNGEIYIHRAGYKFFKYHGLKTLVIDEFINVNTLSLRRSPTNAWYPVGSGTCISNSFKPYMVIASLFGSFILSTQR